MELFWHQVKENQHADLWENMQVFILKGDIFSDLGHLNPINNQILPKRKQLHQQPFRLKILHFNDLHGQLSKVNQNDYLPVFSRIVSKIHEIRLECKEDPDVACLVFSAGDDCIGTPFDLLLKDDQGNYLSHASYQVFAKAGINAVIPGNHDLDLGMHFLTTAIQRDGDFPVLAANLRSKNPLQNLFTPVAIYSVKGIRVGVIGITTPVGSYIRKDVDYEILDPVYVVKSLLPLVRENSDLVILLSHLGNNLQSTTAPTAIAGDVELARELPFGSVDLIIGGHTHDVLNLEKLEPVNIINGIPITQAGSLGNYLGEVEFTCSDRIALKQVRLLPVEKIPVEQDFEKNIIQPIIQKLQSYSQKVIGVVEKNEFLLDEYQNKYQPGTESASFNFLTDNLVECSNSIGFPVDLAVIDTTGFQPVIQPGNSISYIDLWRMLPYENTLILVCMPGDVLMDLIRLNVQQCVWPDQNQAECLVFHFSHEIRYQIYKNNENSKMEVRSIRFNGNPVNELPREYLLASSSYFLSILKLWQRHSLKLQNEVEEILQKIKIEDTGWLIRDLMMERIRQLGGINTMGGARTDGRIEWIKNSLKGS